MRNFICFCFCCCCMLFVSGCSHISLSCTKETKSFADFATSYEKYNFVYKNDTIYKLSASMEVIFSEDTLSSDENIVDNMGATTSSSFSDLLGKRGVSYSLSNKSNGFVSKLKINFSKLDDESKKNITFINYKDSYSAMKKNMENKGFECK